MRMRGTRTDCLQIVPALVLGAIVWTKLSGEMRQAPVPSPTQTVSPPSAWTTPARHWLYGGPTSGGLNLGRLSM